MARFLKPLVRSGGYYPSRRWTPLVYPGGYTTANGGEEPAPPPVEKTVIGNPIHILDALAKPAQALSVKLEPIQAGSGDPSPTNIRPISGRTSATVTRTGKNLLENELTTSTVNGTSFTVNADGSITVSGTPTARTRVAIKRGLAWDAREAAVFSFGAMPTETRVFARRIYNGTQDYPTISPSGTTTIGAEIYDIYLEINTSFNGTAFTVYPQLELGSTATAYEPYAGNTYTIALGDTVYGATLDVTTGKLTVDRKFITLLPTMSWQYSALTQRFFVVIGEAVARAGDHVTFGGKCNIFKAGQIGENNAVSYVNSTSPGFAIMYQAVNGDMAVWKQFLTDNTVNVVYELATPLTIQLTAQQVELLQGENNLFSDGEMTLVYLADGNASDEEALNILLGGRYVNNHTEGEPTDREALDILLGR